MSDLIKLAFVGDMGAGKTTAIRAISDREPISTEMPISHGAHGEKTHTTVAMSPPVNSTPTESAAAFSASTVAAHARR